MPKRVKVEGDLYHPRVPEGAVRITRPGRWGNPFPVWQYGRDEALRRFRARLDERPDLVSAARRELAGRDLACWCPPGEPCHGDIWLAFVDGDQP